MKNRDNKFCLFDHILEVYFLDRPNRFLIRCEWKGETIRAFLPNPGRLQELLIPGRLVYLVREEESEHRKTRFTAIAVDREGCPILLHTLRTNDAARYLLQKGRIPGLEKTRILRSEVRVGQNRFDFLLREGEKPLLLEVKSCTLVSGKVAMFPDAVTERGTRHLKELAKLSAEGMETAVLFMVHWPFAEIFMPDYHTDLNFSRTLLRVRRQVRVIPISVTWDQNLCLSPRSRLLQIPWDYIEEEARDRGSYLVILGLKRNRTLSVGRLGEVVFRRGFYIYVGSAMANLSQRIERHRRLRKAHHWHIDELRAVADFHSVLAIRSSERLECEISKSLSMISEWDIPGFGSTDCSCRTHLFGVSSDPLRSEEFHKLLQHFRMNRYNQLHFTS